MKKNIDTWCIEVTKENRQLIIDWLIREKVRWYPSFGPEKYVYIDDKGVIDSYCVYDDYHYLITTEEFLQKINVQQEFSIWN